MKQSIFKTGNSLAITVPSNIVKLWGIKPGDQVEVKLYPQKGEIRLKFGHVIQLAFSDLLLGRGKKSTGRKG